MYQMNRSIPVQTFSVNVPACRPFQLFASLGSVAYFGWVQNTSLSAQIYTPMFASFGEDNGVSTIRFGTFDTCTTPFKQGKFP